MSFEERFCATGRHRHQLPEIEAFEHHLDVLTQRIIHPIGRESELQQSALAITDSFATVLSILIGKFRTEMTPEAISDAKYFSDYYLKFPHGRGR